MPNKYIYIVRICQIKTKSQKRNLTNMRKISTIHHLTKPKKESTRNETGDRWFKEDVKIQISN